MVWTLVYMIGTGPSYMEVQRFETEAACIEEGQWRTAKSPIYGPHPWTCLKAGEKLLSPKRFIFDWEAMAAPSRDKRPEAASNPK